MNADAVEMRTLFRSVGSTVKFNFHKHKKYRKKITEEFNIIQFLQFFLLLLKIAVVSEVDVVSILEQSKMCLAKLSMRNSFFL